MKQISDLLFSVLYGARVTDMETCYTVFAANVVKDIELKARRFDFEPEITAKIIKKCHEIIEVSVSYNLISVEEGKEIEWKDGAQVIFV